jgi:limonene 1,2-monooxygenase
MVARYVIPEVNRMLDDYRESRMHVVNNPEPFQQRDKAVMNKILQHDSAAAALAKMANTGRLAMPGVAAGLSNKAG